MNIIITAGRILLLSVLESTCGVQYTGTNRPFCYVVWILYLRSELNRSTGWHYIRILVHLSWTWAVFISTFINIGDIIIYIFVLCPSGLRKREGQYIWNQTSPGGKLILGWIVKEREKANIFRTKLVLEGSWFWLRLLLFYRKNSTAGDLGFLPVQYMCTNGHFVWVQYLRMNLADLQVDIIWQ